MAVEAVIVDLDGTLLSGDSIVDGALEMLRSLRERGYIVVIASNRPNAASRIDRAGLEYDAIIDRVSVGSSKGTADWVNSVCANFNLEPNSVVWLGDSDMDFYAALAGRVTYFNAAWSAPDFRYGIPLTHPMALLDVLGQCFSKKHLWYCKLETTDQLGRRVSRRSLIDGRGAGSTALKRDLISFFKKSGSPRNLASFVLLHLLGSIYDEGLHREVDYWTIYPGHGGGPSPAFAPYIDLVAKLFRDRFIPDLLVRHTPSRKSAFARYGGNSVDFYNQIDTIHVNSEYRNQIQGKRILVFDDFTTQGFALECARNLLLAARCSEVIGVTIGKYQTDTNIFVPERGYAWDAFEATSHLQDAFVGRLESGDITQEALRLIRESHVEVSDLRHWPHV